jgi:hypothetical protein
LLGNISFFLALFASPDIWFGGHIAMYSESIISKPDATTIRQIRECAL